MIVDKGATIRLSPAEIECLYVGVQAPISQVALG
jgi:hypothetical protein